MHPILVDMPRSLESGRPRQFLQAKRRPSKQSGENLRPTTAPGIIFPALPHPADSNAPSSQLVLAPARSPASHARQATAPTYHLYVDLAAYTFVAVVTGARLTLSCRLCSSRVNRMIGRSLTMALTRPARSGAAFAGRQFPTVESD
jgi:hypothetical protein